MFVNLDGRWFNTDLIAAICPVDDGDEQTKLFIEGSSPVDGGFLIDMPTDEVLEIVRHADLHDLHEIDTLLAEELKKPA